MKKSKRNIDYNATFQVEIVSDWKADKFKLNKKENELKKAENFEEISKNLMEKDELREKHLQSALKHKLSIPVPDIVEIDKEDYDKLYPDNYSIPKIRIMAQPKDEDEIEYDADSEDDEWLKENGQALKLTYDDFEKYMDYLEKKSLDTKIVPSVCDFIAHFKNPNLLIAIEATYDYWLNKRLNTNGNALLYSLKKDKPKSGAKNRILPYKNDPYIAFRPCRERMNLRKNRLRDHENYCKMLDIREKIEELLKFYKTNALCETTKHELLKLRFATFQDQYHSGGFNSCYLEKEVQCNTEFLLRDLKENRIGYDMHRNGEDIRLNDMDEDLSDDCDSDIFPFKRIANCQYHEIKNDCFEPDFIPECDGKALFYNTDEGVTRRRLGRGGRIIYDRLNAPKDTSIVSEFHKIDYCKNIFVKRCNDSPRASPLSAADNQTFNLNDYEVICTFDK